MLLNRTRHISQAKRAISGDMCVWANEKTGVGWGWGEDCRLPLIPTHHPDFAALLWNIVSF